MEAQKAEERERLKREKIQSFNKSLKANLNTTLAKKREQKERTVGVFARCAIDDGEGRGGGAEGQVSEHVYEPETEEEAHGIRN